MNTSYNYTNKELINKTIKINYLQSYTNLINSNYNEEISLINNDINYINCNNNVYYNYLSSNITNINIEQLNNLYWKTPYGTIRLSYNINITLNYIDVSYTNINNNNVNRIYLYFIENNSYKFIGSILNVTNINTILHNYSKKDYVIYFENIGMNKNEYNDLYIENIKIGYNNKINNTIINYNSNLVSVKIDNIINKYIVPISYLDINTINETNDLLLSNSKSSIIEYHLDKERSIKYYNIKQKINLLNTYEYETLIIHNILIETEINTTSIIFVEISNNLKVNNIILHNSNKYIIKEVDLTLKQIKLNNILDIEIGDTIQLYVSEYETLTIQNIIKEH